MVILLGGLKMFLLVKCPVCETEWNYYQKIPSKGTVIEYQHNCPTCGSNSYISLAQNNKTIQRTLKSNAPDFNVSLKGK